ncbi:MAG TPA: phosphoribosylglycinamide formyltransferase [Puia sp.]|nr:phosphoribosylglycinamide formyltransferase [Puia sp.]
MSSTQLAIFASGAGTNAQKIIDHFRADHSINVAMIVCNKSQAGVITVARKENIPFVILEKEKFTAGEFYVSVLREKKIDFLVLAGFLWKLPVDLVRSYPKKILNIHPALLPKYGGRGMFGNHVHESVIKNEDKESGITVHYVDEIYDHGKIIFQAKCIIEKNETAESLANKIHLLEYKNYPKLIELIVNLKNIVKT